MDDQFFLQDSRSNVGSRSMFWRLGGGYTSNLDEAEQFTRAAAVKQYECRETDLPWPVVYVRALAEVGVDHQDLKLTPEQALASASADDRLYYAYKQTWDGNCLVWNAVGVGPTSNLADASTWSQDRASAIDEACVPWPKAYIDQHSRPVVRTIVLDHRKALREAGLKLPKIKRQRFRRYVANCHGCGRFLSERQVYGACPHCDASNAP
ncbi:hypothetical protein [Stutzerimonas nitrititolerans]|uniref:hypothetical protein n=1 Tax=Stutzerimonas nitrititolerans TaxID=2482751 RepID=UPI0028AA5B67|nr:hypothetical protein [Stutzerimonas nitrititolerans]